MRAKGSWIAMAVLAGRVTTAVAAEPVVLAHSDWESYHAGIVDVVGDPNQHGAAKLYDSAPSIPTPGREWTRLTATAGSPRNPVDIDFLGPNDDYSSNLRSCSTQVDFTYFETLVAVPSGFKVNTATIAIGPLDDGARVLVFTSEHPEGAVPDGGVVYLGDVKTIDLSSLIQSGETNRIVVQHVDDCAAQSWLGTVVLSVNGQATSTGSRTTWGGLKILYR